MEFGELNFRVNELRNALNSLLGEKAFVPITVAPPSNDSDQGSFICLVNWCYVILFESGRITIPYLLKLASGLDEGEVRLKDTQGIVQALRTMTSHNSDFANERDRNTVLRTNRWYTDNGATGGLSPSDAQGWRNCFEALCDEMARVILHCQSVISQVLMDSDDGEMAIANLLRRIDRNWAAYKFDEIVSDACDTFGIRLDVVKFRNQRVSAWRTFLQTVRDDDCPEHRLRSMIERDVLDHAKDVLPITGRDVMIALDIGPGPIVGQKVEIAQRLFSEGVRDPDELLQILVQCEKP